MWGDDFSHADAAKTFKWLDEIEESFMRMVGTKEQSYYNLQRSTMARFIDSVRAEARQN